MLTKKSRSSNMKQRIAFFESGGSFAENSQLEEFDYNNEDEQWSLTNSRKNNNKEKTRNTLTDEEGLILPRKLINPCSESTEHRDLHRELLFINKTGRNVLNQKSELQRALEKHRKHVDEKDSRLQKMAAKTSLEKALEARARRLEEVDNKDGDSKENNQKNLESNEFLKVHARLRGKAVNV